MRISFGVNRARVRSSSWKSLPIRPQASKALVGASLFLLLPWALAERCVPFLQPNPHPPSGPGLGLSSLPLKFSANAAVPTFHGPNSQLPETLFLRGALGSCLSSQRAGCSGAMFPAPRWSDLKLSRAIDREARPLGPCLYEALMA